MIEKSNSANFALATIAILGQPPRREFMKILVYFRSGISQIFIIPKDITAIEFRRIAETVGGGICRVEFIQKKEKLKKLNTAY
jgi:hypothetical protein